MTGIELFDLAVYWAQKRAQYRRLASEGGARHLTPRQCQLRARQAEGHILDLSIKAERLARRNLAQGGAA